MKNAARINENILNRVLDCEDVTSVLETMRDSCFAIGGDKFSYHPEVMFEGVASLHSEVYAVGFPEEWVDSYLRDGWRLIDPCPAITIQHGKPMTWQEALRSRKLSKSEQDYVAHSRKLGLAAGIGFPLWGPNGHNAFVAIGFPSNASLPDRDAINGEHVLLMSAHQKICQLTASNSRSLSLSEREKEVLTWVGRGKSNTDIASILSISTDTVATYLRRIYAKLNCHDRIGAVIKALRLGLIRI